jgi:CARDB
VNRRLILGIFVLALFPVGVSAQRCLGGNPAITHVGVQTVHRMGTMNQYRLVGTVKNLGTANQPSSTLQFVDIYDGAEKVDAKTIPPLTAAGSTTFTYNWSRAYDAGVGSTTFYFKMRMVHGTNCNPANVGSFKLTF